MRLKFLCLALVLMGLALFTYRWQVLDYPVLPDTDSPLYQIEAQIDVEGRGDAARIGLFVPPDGGRFGILEEDFVSSNFALTTQSDPVGNRAAVWSTGQLFGRSTAYYRALFYRLPQAEPPDAAMLPPDELPEDVRLPERLDDARHAAAEALAEEIEEAASGLETRVGLLIERLQGDRTGTNAAALGGDGGRFETASAAAYVLSIDDISARVVRGLPLDSEERSVTPVAWLEVWTGDEWASFDAETGDPFRPDDHLIWWRGPADLVDVEGAELTLSSYALERQEIGAVASLKRRASVSEDPLAAFTLLELPLNTQNIFRLLLMIPVGVLLLVIMRQIVGIETLGTFMPVLIALAFRVTDLIYGVLFFTLLVSFGLMVRFALAKLNLLLVPRLAAMLVIVILMMIGMSLLADSVSLGLGLSVALFPIVILTMTIERMSVTWEENGPGEAMEQGIGSLIVAVLAYGVMNIPLLEHLLFVFPELSLLILAALLALGRYSGYRLSELRRFRDLAREG